MKIVLDISRLLAVTDLGTLLERIAEAWTTLLDAQGARVFVHDPVTNELWTPTGEGPRRVPADSGLLGVVFRTGHTQAARGALRAPLLDLDGQILGVVEVLMGAVTPEDRVLAGLLAEHSAFAIQRFRMVREVHAGSELRREMDVARQVQAALIPRVAPVVHGLQAEGWMRAASITGGDTYDVWKMGDGRLGIFVGDASGHGLAAALVISQVRAMLRVLAEIRCDPEWILTRLNSRLNEDLADGRFVTAFVGCLARDGRLEWSSAGQGPLFVKRAGGLDCLQATSAPLGVAAELGNEGSARLYLEPGEMLVVMTDGVLEAGSPGGELLGVERVSRVIDQGPGMEPAHVMTGLRAAVREWQGREEPTDDQTIVIVRRMLVLASRTVGQ